MYSDSVHVICSFPVLEGRASSVFFLFRVDENGVLIKAILSRKRSAYKTSFEHRLFSSSQDACLFIIGSGIFFFFRVDPALSGHLVVEGGAVAGLEVWPVAPLSVQALSTRTGFVGDSQASVKHPWPDSYVHQAPPFLRHITTAGATLFIYFLLHSSHSFLRRVVELLCQYKHQVGINGDMQ